MGLDTAITNLAAAKTLIGLAPVAGPVLAGVMDVATEICKGARIAPSFLRLSISDPRLEREDGGRAV
jgi:hypothetical protein